MDICNHNYCPHLHFKKCRRDRQMKLQYTTRPTKQIDITCNVHPKVLNLTTRNIPTLAYEKYSEAQVIPQQDQTNFSKNFYLQNCPENFQLRNTIVSDQQQQMNEGNSYILALGAAKQYSIFAKQRENHLINAQRRAKISYHNYFQKKKEEVLKLKEEQRKWVTDYFRKVEDLIAHIFGHNTQNEDPNLQDKLFIKEQGGKNAKTLAGFKIRDAASALQILTSLRAILLGKKILLQQERKDQEHNKSVSASYMNSSSDQSQSQNTSQAASFMSATTNASKQNGQQHFAEQFCDFKALEKKWGVKDVGEIRNIIRRLLANKLVNNAEGHQMREKKRAANNNKMLSRQLQKLGQSLPITVKSKSTKGSLAKTARKKEIESSLKDEAPIPAFKESLNKQQQKIKSTLLKGGQFDSIGDIYERNRNYSLLFKNRQKTSKFELSFRQDYHPQTSRI